jgi:hypothetical protein
MANIHIARNHESLGTFSEEAIREGISTGRFTGADLCWREGMPAWKPLGEMAPQWGMELPAPALAPDVDLSKAPLGDGSGPSWEDRENIGFFPAIAGTLRAVLFHPAQTFASLKQTGGFASPLLYFVLLSSVMFAVFALYQMAGSAVNPAVLGPQFEHVPKTAITVALIGSILISPARYVVTAFLSSGITHLCLKLLGGANRPFETTFRVICYAQASAAVLNILPVFGSLIGMIWGACCIIIGLREAHGTGGWKATLALVLPGLLCCGLLVIVGAAAGFGIAGMTKMGH